MDFTKLIILNDLNRVCRIPKQVPMAWAISMMLELDLQTIDRLLNGMLWTLGPYLDEKGAITERPWLFELAESYNEIVSMLPASWKLEHHQFLQYD